MYFILSGIIIPILFVGMKQSKINGDLDGKVQRLTGFILIFLIYLIGILFF